MSHWKIAAAQYEPLHTSVTEHVAHHLQFIQAAAQCQCELLVFPSLSLLGCVDEHDALPAPPDEALLEPRPCRRDLSYDNHCGTTGGT